MIISHIAGLKWGINERNKFKISLFVKKKTIIKNSNKNPQEWAWRAWATGESIVLNLKLY